MFAWLTGKKREPAAEGGKDLLVVSRTVPAPAERAFAVFVDDFKSWWPRDFTWGGDDVAEIGIEAKLGGRCYERTKDGGEAVWGTVLTVARPSHIVLAWQIGPDRSAVDNEAAASRVDVRFAEDQRRRLRTSSSSTATSRATARAGRRTGPPWRRPRAGRA